MEICEVYCFRAIRRPDFFNFSIHILFKGTEHAHVHWLLHCCGIANKTWK